MSCPVCGHTEVSSTIEKRPIKALYGPTIEVDTVLNTCLACKESGDFAAVNDHPIQLAVEMSSLRSVPEMVRLLKEMDCIPPHIEATVGLPLGSISRCAEGHYDAAVIVTLRMVLTFPPILRFMQSAWALHGV